MADLAKLKQLNRIEELVEEQGYRLEKRSGERIWKCVQDPDLVVNVEKQVYRWPSKGEKGDIFEWIIRRLEWPMSKTITYLTNRPNMAAEDRPHWPVVAGNPDGSEKRTKGSGHIVEKAPVPEGLVNDERLAMVRWLGKDYEGGIDRLFRLSLSRLLEVKVSIPRLFLPMYGYIHDASEFCIFCYQDLPAYSSGGAFVSIQVGNDYEILKGSGVYCRKCVNTFERWLKAIDLLAVLIGERDRLEEPEKRVKQEVEAAIEERSDYE